MPRYLTLGAEELHQLAGLPHAAIVLYLALRSRMDFRTAIVGESVAVSWQALVEDLYIEPHRGEIPGGGPWRSPGREATRRICGWLVRAGLVQLRSNPMQAQLLFRLPMARTLSRVQKKPDRNPTGLPDRGKTEGISTETRPGKSGDTRQTSVTQRPRQTAAAAQGVSRAIEAAPVLWPPGTTKALERAFRAVATKHQLAPESFQLLLDELRGIQRKAPVRNGPALLEQLAQQLDRGEFYGTAADQERAGGVGLSPAEIQWANEGGRHDT